MTSAIYYRLLGYTATLALHSFTLIDTKTRLSITRVEDQRVADFEVLQIKFITIWTFLLQSSYAVLGLSCDTFVLLSRKPNFISNLLVRVRELMFSSLVWPTSLMIPVMFWPLYLYDPLLVFPSYIDKILSNANNHGLHTAIALTVLWELMFLPRTTTPASHVGRLSITLGYLLVYLVVLISSYIQTGHWIYPIMDKLQGTIFLPVIIISVLILSLTFYFIQWPLTEFVSNKNKIKKT